MKILQDPLNLNDYNITSDDSCWVGHSQTKPTCEENERSYTSSCWVAHNV